MAEIDPATSEPPPVGVRLREAREAQGVELAEIAARTRIPLRHLQAIERGEYGALPAMTYATGFTRAYARALGIDDVEMVRDLRAELVHVDTHPEYQPYAAADPARVPPRWLAWGGALAALLVLALFGWWYTTRDALPDDTIVAAAPEGSSSGDAGARASAPAPVVPAVPASGPVVLTASAPVWLRIYDAADARLFEREMAAGETYTVPADADRPMILTGRPDVLAITVAGRAIPPLGDGSRSVSGIELTPAALAARAAAASAPPVAGDIATP